MRNLYATNYYFHRHEEKLGCEGGEEKSRPAGRVCRRRERKVGAAVGCAGGGREKPSDFGNLFFEKGNLIKGGAPIECFGRLRGG